jgi:hypothetical protein
MNIAAWRRWLAFYWAFAWRACVICVGMVLAFYLVAAPIEAAAGVPPRVAVSFDLTMLLLLTMAGLCLALQWCSRVRYGQYRLLVQPARVVGLSFGQALRVTWAQFWRAAIVAVPLYIVLRLLWMPWTPIDLACLGAIGLWAMRAAIRVEYRSFQLHWIAEQITV